jgi:ppGpp synthetase/RelA/SpoT-type nucleotidyltranferase
MGVIGKVAKMDSSTTERVRFDDDIEAYRENSLRLRNDALTALDSLVKKIPTSVLSKISYAYNARVKTEHGILEKISRKRKEEEKSSYSIHDITDIIGIRFVTLYKSQIIDILELLMAELTGKLVKGSKFEQSDIRQLFKPLSLKEVKVYHNQSVDHFVNKCVATLEKSLERQITPEEKTDYSSIHIVAIVESSEGKPVPIEIQVRSVFEDAWSELNHKFKYASEEGKKTISKANNPILVNRMLSNLKNFTDACAEFADLISDEANGTTEDPLESTVLDAGDGIDVFKRLKEVGVPPQFLKNYASALRTKKEVEEFRITSEGNNTNEVDTKFESLSLKYQELYELSGTIDVDERARSLCRYYCLMNSAFCYLSSTKLHGKSIPIYEKLSVEFPTHPMVNFRYGTALEKKGEVSAGITLIEKSLLSAVDLYSIPENLDCDELPIKDFLHIKNKAPIKHGYFIWQNAEEQFKSNEISTEEYVNQVSEAYFISQQVYTLKIDVLDENEDDALLSVHNNQLYYSVEIMELGNENQEIELDGSFWIGMINTHLEYLLEQATVKDDDIWRLETLARAHFFTKEYQIAKEYSDKVMALAVSGKINDASSEELLDMVKKSHQLSMRIAEARITT